MILGTRQLQHIAGSYYLCIPKGWVITNQLQPGHKMILEVNEQGHLMVKKND